MRRVIAVLMMALVAVPAVAATDDEPAVNRKSPPKVALFYRGERVQAADAYTYCWSHYSDGGGTGSCADGFASYPEPAQVAAPAQLRLRIRYPVKPRRWFLSAYKKIIDHEYWVEPVGKAEKIPFKLRPHRVRGEIRSWDVVFRVTESLRHHYIDAGGYLYQGDAWYALHLQT